jgi:hypothetical protein
VVTLNFALTDEQAAKFWPLYERNLSEVSGVGDRVAGLVRE